MLNFIAKRHAQSLSKTARHGMAAALLALLLLAAAPGCGFPYLDTQASAPAGTLAFDPADETLSVHILDVGQADAILIRQGDSAMLVDAAEPDYADAVVSYIKEQGVEELTYLVATHPHEDHIGGMPAVLEAFSVKRIFMPYVEHDTKTYEALLDAILDRGLTAEAPEPGDEYILGSAKITMLSPPKDAEFDDLNDYSIAFLLEFEGCSMLFTGDMGEAAEELVLAEGRDIQCDVLKVGHHGSKTASSEAFLDAADPQYAVMTVSADAKSSLPAASIVKRYEERGITIYRTDTDGTVVVRMNDGEIGFSCASGRE